MDKVIVIGNCQKPRATKREPQEGVVVSVDGISPCILASNYKGTMAKILVDYTRPQKYHMIGAARGRCYHNGMLTTLEMRANVTNTIESNPGINLLVEIWK